MTIPTITPSLAVEAAAYLTKADPILGLIIDASGPCTIRPHTNYYEALVDAIIGQQLSVAAARSISQRLLTMFDTVFPSPQQLVAVSTDELRIIGLSRPKARYIIDLAEHIVDGRLLFDEFDQLDNNTIVEKLTTVKGIGVWTVHMFLMFCMGRLDVLPIGDLGIRNGVKKLYGLENTPTPEGVTLLAAQKHWSPYETIASWYVWRADEVPD